MVMPMFPGMAATARTLTGWVWCCATILGAMMAPQAALAQAAPSPVCVSAVATDLLGAVQAMGALADGTLIAAAKGLSLAREAGGEIAVSALTGDADTGPVFALHDLAGAGLLIGAENGLFVGRAVNGKLALARAGDVGPVVQMLEFPDGGALIEAAKGWFLARAESGKVTILPVVTVAPATLGNIGRLRSMRSVPGGGVLIEATVWFMAREEGGKLTTLAGDAATGVVDAIGDWPGGQLLIHTEQNGWFLGSAEDGKLVVKPAGNADTGRVFQDEDPGTGMLVWARNGLFVAREQGGKVTLARPRAPTPGRRSRCIELGSGLLISAEKGLFFAREQDGRVAIAPAGDAAIGPALSGGIHQLLAAAR
jgi:hypothetical protein